jgi:twitching motility protein PilT
VVAAAQMAVAQAVPAAVAKAAREAVAEAMPATVADAVSAAVTDAVPGAVAAAARTAVAEAAAAAVARAACAAVAAAATAALAEVSPRVVSVSAPQQGERCAEPAAGQASQNASVKPLVEASPESPSRALLPSPRVLPTSRHVTNSEPATPSPVVETPAGLERLLRAAAACRGSTVYLLSNARPLVCVDGRLQPIDGEPLRTASEIVSMMRTLMPDFDHEALRTGATVEWTCELKDIGRVRCTGFSDHRGPGGVFRMPVHAATVNQLGLAQEIQSLALEPAGLVLVVGSRSSGKRTLMSALVDLINRTLHAYVISIEHEVNTVHAPGNSIISQREVRRNEDEMLTAARAALNEDPDVLLLEEIRTGSLMNVALESAASGQLVIGGFDAHNSVEAIERIVALYSPEHAQQVQLALAATLRGIVAQVLLTDVRGGRIAAREVLLNTPAIAGVIADGKTAQLPGTNGMVPLSDALGAYVEKGIVNIGEAYRHVTDRSAFTALLKRRGIDTSSIERFE